MTTAAAERTLDEVALFQLLPGLLGHVPWVRLGDWPTPVEPLPALTDALGGPPIYVKREDLSSQVYGGNKVRTLEAVMGRAAAAGADRIWATGAYGSNHALATALHAPTAGLRTGVAVFPQPLTKPAAANLRAMMSVSPAVHLMATPLSVPGTIAWLRRRPSDDNNFVMAPGGATPEGSMGALSAALELAQQVATGSCPAPARIVLAVGSGCTTAGLLAGLHVAAALGIGFGPGRAPIPHVTAVRVTPWPITSPTRIAILARRAVGLLADLGCAAANRVGFRALRSGLDVERRDLGSGYGKPTARGYRAMALFRDSGGPVLDVVYTAKSAAALIDLARAGVPGPVLYWATKSSAPLPEPTPAQLAAVPETLATWLGALA